MAEQSSLEARAGTAAGNSTDRMESPRLVPETARAEASKAEPVRLDGGVADAFKADPPRTAGKIFVASTTNRIRDAKAASPKADPVKTDASKVDMSKVEIPRVGKMASASPVDRSWDSKSTAAKAAAEAGKAAQQLKQDVSKPDAPKAGAPRTADRAKVSLSRLFGQLILATLPMVRSLVAWRPRSASPAPASPTAPSPRAASPKPDVRAAAGSVLPGKRPLSSLAAVAAIAAAAGAIGGVLVTMLFPQVPGEAAMATSDNATLEASVARIDSDLQALKTGAEQGGQPGQVGQGLDNQTADRLDRLERAEADSSAKILRLNEATERLRVAVQSTPGMAPIPPVPPVASPRERETTGSATQSSTAASAFGAVRPAMAAATPATATPKPVDTGKLPVVPGWSLRDVNHGLALIEGRNGFYEVYAGDPIPGLGRVDSIKRQDGRWVVVTTQGLVVSR
jgi:hypothetical protein